MQRRNFLFMLNAGALEASLLGAAPLAQAFFPQNGPARTILVTGGSYVRYRSIFVNVALGLRTFGLIDWAPGESEALADGTPRGTADLWKALSERAGGKIFHFLPDGHYDYGFSDAGRAAARKAVLKRLEEAKDVDLILVFGTEATQDLAAAVKDVPIVSLGSSDPVRTGIVKSPDDSGQDNLHAIVVEGYYDWQTESFHAVQPFRKLGFLFAKERNAKSGEPEIREACRRLGVDFVFRNYSEGAQPEGSEYVFRGALSALLNEGVDAVILPWFTASDEGFAEIVGLLEKRGIPSFSQSGPDFVARGILLGPGEESFESYGLFEADAIRQILEGVKPRDIPQRFVQRGRLVVNLVTAMRMGWKPPFDLLVAAERAYTTQTPTMK